MERLTDKKDVGSYFYPKCFEKCGGLGTSSKCDNCDITTSICEKLGEYEDLEEQGRLVKLPCKVGDTVYRITDGMIQEFEINKFVVSYSIFNNEATVYMYFVGGHGGCSIDFYGVSVFGTQTEAEAKLKELRGEA